MPKKKEYIHFGGFEWLVLDKRGYSNEMLIITKESLAYRNFHNEEGRVNWAESEIREFLNKLYHTEFTEEEKSRVCPTILLHGFNTLQDGKIRTAGVWTSDKLFLLSVDETVKYKLGKIHFYIEEPGWWWTRSNGWHPDTIITVEAKKRGVGVIDENGMEAYYFRTEEPQKPMAGVRPAMWIADVSI